MCGPIGREASHEALAKGMNSKRGSLSDLSGDFKVSKDDGKCEINKDGAALVPLTEPQLSPKLVVPRLVTLPDQLTERHGPMLSFKELSHFL